MSDNKRMSDSSFIPPPLAAGTKGQSSLHPLLQQALVHWQFDPQSWQLFLEFDETKRNKQDSKVALAILVIIALVMGVFFFLGVGEAVCAVGIFAGIILLAVIVHFLIQRQRYQGMVSHRAGGGGDVYITPEGIWANGVWFDWGDQTPWRLSTVTPVLADTGVGLPPGALSYIDSNAAAERPADIGRGLIKSGVCRCRLVRRTRRGKSSVTLAFPAVNHK